MSNTQEIFRSLLVALGAFEIFSNLTYLISSDGIDKARHQHQEIPANVTDIQMKRKVIAMFIAGCLFLTAGLYSYITHGFQQYASYAVLILFSAYALAEALYYRYIRTFCMFSLSLVITCICIFTC